MGIVIRASLLEAGWISRYESHGNDRAAFA